LIFAGKVGTGFDRAESARLVKRLEPLAQRTPPFKVVPNLARRGAIWIRPKLVAQIKFTEWTGGNSLRHPSYQGLREDKPAEQVIREKKKRLKKAVGPIKFWVRRRRPTRFTLKSDRKLVSAGHGTQDINQD
jgi:bifunctional non-homologous end joining protein LigD